MGIINRTILLLISVAACSALWAQNADVPAIQYLVALEYPRMAHMAGVQGPVSVRLQIGGVGSVISAKALSGSGLLIDPLLKTLKQWRFAPCTESISACMVQISIQFVLRGGPLDISDLKTEFEFDAPDRITVTSQFARAIVDWARSN
jgi:TonB family protein